MPPSPRLAHLLRLALVGSALAIAVLGRIDAIAAPDDEPPAATDDATRGSRSGRIRLPTPDPQATPDQLLDYIERIADPALEPDSRGRQRYHRRKVASLTIDAADAILAQVAADDALRSLAVLIKLDALERLLDLDEPRAEDQLKAFTNSLADDLDPAIAARVNRLREEQAGRDRLDTLTGQPIELDGTLLDGGSFDPESLAGRVVLVDFWATWCGPCVAEIPRVRELYDRYHDRGFEVVGISLDDDHAALAAFVAERDIPWPIIVDGDRPADGRGKLAARYGIAAIPTMILVGRDGAVVSVAARGETLETLLAEAFPDPPADAPAP